jgi:hypothetical protein
MTPWQQWLRDGDPATRDVLSEQEAQSIRRAVVAAARESRAVAPAWPRQLAIAAMATLAIASALIVSRPWTTAPERSIAPPPIVPAEPAERRQLQFATPGGTRIIWTFNPEFVLTEAIP